MQAQLNRILSQTKDTGDFGRLQRVVNAIERDRDYKVLNGKQLSVVTNKQLSRIDKAVTVQGRRNAIRRAAAGGSAG